MMDRDKQIEEYLMHYGILGMKWGRRKNKNGSYTTDASKTAKGDRDSTVTTQRRMSNKELQARIKRLEMEKRYKDLLGDNRVIQQKSALEKVANTMGNLGKIAENASKIAAFAKTINDIANATSKKKKSSSK